ncbi:MAG: peptidylprolyl isomerase, partial [Verrucomicrobiota bacterium]|nr:peptidylprolyl isomerase [Verrucomicrobiota bacterium]
MKFSAPLLLAFLCAGLPAAQALAPKSNVGPLVTDAIGNYGQYVETTRIIDLNSFFKDPDASAAAQLTTPLGTMNFTLDGETAPITVANFLNYVNSGNYFKVDPKNGQLASTFFHRAVSGFVIQAGGFLSTLDPTASNGVIQPTAVTTFPAIQNEPAISNTRGTIAMAKLSGDPNSATSQWFINLADNSANLDNQNGGFTVFGRVAGNGMTVADNIVALPKYAGPAPFDTLPVRNYTSGNPVRPENLVTIPGFTQISPLTFTASSDNTAIATVVTSGTNLLVNSAQQLGFAHITVTATDLDGATVSQSFTVTVNSAPARLTNISSRAKCGSGDDVLIGGFIVRGSGSKTIVMRTLGPSLAQYGITDTLPNPAVSLHDTSSTLAANDDWSNGGQQQLLTDLHRNPDDPSEAALVATVPAGSGDASYTAIMQNNSGGTGVGIIEIYDYDYTSGSTLHNISSRGLV